MKHLKTTATLPAKPEPSGSEPFRFQSTSNPALVRGHHPPRGGDVFPLVVPLVMARVGIGAGVGVALVLSGLWFVAMLKTSEMPH